MSEERKGVTAGKASRISSGKEASRISGGKVTRAGKEAAGILGEKKGSGILAEDEARARLVQMVEESAAVFHPDTDFTFACWEFHLPGGFSVWVNARNGLVISAGRVVNRA